MFNKYKWIGIGGLGIIIFLAFVVFKDHNNPKIESVSLTNNRVEVLNGAERTIIRASDIKDFIAINTQNSALYLFDTYDAEYAAVTEAEVLALQEYFFEYINENNIIYSLTKGGEDCDDFAKIFSRLFADKWYGGKNEKLPPAVGYYAYLRRDDQKHMIVVAFTNKNNVLHPMFFEVRPYVQKTDVNLEEFLSCIGGEMN